MNKKIWTFLCWLPFLYLLPFLLVGLINGRETAFARHLPDLEDCLPAILSVQIPDDYEAETLKAQAVIARTNLYRKLRDPNLLSILHTLRNEWKKNGTGIGFLQRKWFFPSDVYRKAAEETKLRVLKLDGALPLVPYHKISSGKTRDGREVFHDDTYRYLVSVDSYQDKNSPDYEKTFTLSKSLLSSSLKAEEIDSQGYVLQLQKNGRPVDGEEFRIRMLLPSSNFSIEERGNSYFVTCRGSGHGIGFSQYGGNELAKSGYKYTDLLKHYFPKLHLE